MHVLVASSLFRSKFRIKVSLHKGHGANGWVLLVLPSTIRRRVSKTKLEKKKKKSYLDRLNCGVNEYNHPENGHGDVLQFFLLRLRASLIVQHSWIDVTKGDTNKDINPHLIKKKRKKSTHQAKHPTNATNLSKSAAPQELIAVVNNKTAHLKMFFVHLTLESTLPLRVKMPFSRMRTAGKSCSGTDSKIASAYRNWT